MTDKAKGAVARPLPRTIPPGVSVPWPPASWQVPGTLEERLQCIAALVEQIAILARRLSPGGGRDGLSAEAREQAVRAFHERLARAECELRQIQERSRLA